MLFEYIPSRVGVDRVSTLTGDGDIPEGPTGSRTLTLLDGGSNTVTATLPAAAFCKNKEYAVKCIDAGFQCGFIARVPDTVDDSAALVVLGLYEIKTVRSDGLNWWVV